MRVLFDNSVPARLRHFFRGHEVVLSIDLGWERLENGNLLTAAEDAAFEVFVTADQGIRSEQNLIGRKLAIVALGSNRWSILKRRGKEIVERVTAATNGEYMFLEFRKDINVVEHRRCLPMYALSSVIQTMLLNI